MKDGSQVIGWPRDYSDVTERELYLQDVTISKGNDKYSLENLYIGDLSNVLYISISKGKGGK